MHTHDRDTAWMSQRTMETAAWRALTPAAQALYPWLLLDCVGPRHNGNVKMSVRQAAKYMGSTPTTASRALHDLQAKGFLLMTTRPRHGATPTYELTELTRGEKRKACRLFARWTPGGDFHVPSLRD